MKVENYSSKQSSFRKLNRSESESLLEKISNEIVGMNSLDGVRLDPTTAAHYIEKNAKKMRFVAVNAGYSTIQLLIEEIYYHSYENSVLAGDANYRKLRDLFIEKSSTNDSRLVDRKLTGRY